MRSHVLDNRIPPPVVMILLGALMSLSLWLGPRQIGLAWLVGAVFFAVGIVIAALGFREFRRFRTTPDLIYIDKAKTLVTTGIFGLSRNPMYLGMAVALFGLAVVLGRWLGFLGPVAYVIYITRFQIVPEERVMREKFAESYAAYAQRVRRWI